MLKSVLPYLIIVTSIIGFISSAVLVYDQIQIWQYHGYVPSCNVNPVLSCGSVIDSKEGHVFGIPAPFFGLITFSIIGTVGVILASGARLKRWVWLGMQMTVMAGVVFAVWLFWLSIYKIHGLCPFCLLTDAAVYTMAWYVTLFNIEQGYILKSNKFRYVNRFIRKHHLEILISIFLIIVIYIIQHFWYYYSRFF